MNGNKKKTMKNDKIAVDTKTEVTTSQKITAVIMMLGALSLAAVIVVGMFPQNDTQDQVAELTVSCASTDCWDSFTVTFRSPDYKVSEPDEQGYQSLTMEDFNVVGTPGKPNLPTKLYSVLMPSNAVYKAVEVISQNKKNIPGEFLIEPTPTPVLITAVDVDIPYEVADQIPPDQQIYQSDDVFPISIVTASKAGQLGKYTVQGFFLTPYQYKPLSKELELVESTTIRVYYENGQPLTEESATYTTLDTQARSLLVNYDQFKDDYYYDNTSRSVTAPPENYHNVIIVPDALSNIPALINYKNYRENQGYSILIKTIESIEANYSGTDLPEKIRNYLKDSYINSGFIYVTLIGTHDVIPMRSCEWGSGDVLPTDFYYADLNGIWNETQYLCGNDIDWYSEVFVGRIPLDAASELTDYLNRVIGFEQSTDAYKKRAFLPAGILSSIRDGATISEDLASNVLEPNGYEVVRAYEEDGSCPSVYDHDFDADRVLVADNWQNNPYGLVMFSSHGNPSRFCSDPCPQASWPCVSIFEGGDIDDLNNEYPSIIYASACDTAHPENQDTLGYRFIRNGAVSFIGATRNVLLSGYKAYFHYFNDSVTRGFDNGKAFGRYRSEWGLTDSFNALAFNLFSDPLLGLTNKHVNINGPEVIEINSNDITLVDVIGNVLGQNLTSYSLEWGFGQHPIFWHDDGITLADGGLVSKFEKSLGNWDISNIIEAGNYTLRVTADFDGETVIREQAYNLSNNVEIYTESIYPYAAQTPVVEILGYVNGFNFDNYIIEWGRGLDPDTWFTDDITLNDGGLEAKFDEPVGSWDISNLDESGDFTLRITAYFDNSEVSVYWPLKVNTYFRWGDWDHWNCGDNELNRPKAVKYINNEIFVVDTYCAEIKVFDENGIFLRSWGQFGNSDQDLYYPSGIDEYDNEIFIADTSNSRIKVFDTQGNFIRKFGYMPPRDVAVSSNGKVFYTAGSQIFGGGQLGYWTNDNTPYGVAVYNSEVYVTEYNGQRVSVYNEMGNLLRQFGTFGFGEGELNSPTDIAIESGKVYVADQGNSRIQVFDTDGNFIESIGSEGDGDMQFHLPYGIDVNQGRIIVADTYNNRIHAIGPIPCSPECTGKQCGDDGCGGSCGTCSTNYTCTDNQCVCTPNCTGNCGPDGCGGTCGICGDGDICSNGFCIPCTPNCVGKNCGHDGCGGSCGTCRSQYWCNAGVCTYCGKSSFLAGTPILTADGSSQPIESLVIGDSVKAYDTETGQLVDNQITQIYVHDADDYLIINSNLKVTKTHPFYSQGEWVEIGNLKVGDTLTDAQGQPITITSIQEINESAQVYNLEVSPDNTYIADGFVVHNKPPGCYTNLR